MTSSMPTSAATARAVAALSPVSSTGVRPSARSSRDRLGARRLDRVGDRDHAAHGAVPGDEDGGAPARLGVAPRSVERGRNGRGPVGHQRRAADLDAVALDDALDAEALAVDEGLHGGQRAAARAPHARSPARSGARRRPRPRRPGAAPRRGRSPTAAATSTTVIRPVVTVPVLSKMMVSTARVDSRTSGPLINNPNCAPRPVPTSSAVGVARPSAHGHAMTSTATAALNARACLAGARGE